MIIENNVLEVLDRATIVGRSITLVGQLDRKLYEKTNKVIEAVGGKWNRKAKAHLFEGDAAEALDPIFLTGSIVSAKQEFGAFYTPPEIAKLVMSEAAIAAGMEVLEPSAGRGALAAPALLAGAKVDCVEIDPKSARMLRSTPYRRVVEGDFLRQPTSQDYDRIIMNPPFAKGQDCAHVLHASRFLRSGGRLVAIMAAGILFRAGRQFDEVRDLVARSNGRIFKLPDRAFAPSGTEVNTAVVVINEASNS